MKFVLSALVSLFAVAAFAADTTATGSATTTNSTTTTTKAAPADASAPATAETTTTTTKSAKMAHGKTWSKEDAEKACAKATDKEACMKKHPTTDKM